MYLYRYDSRIFIIFDYFGSRYDFITACLDLGLAACQFMLFIQGMMKILHVTCYGRGQAVKMIQTGTEISSLLPRLIHNIK